MKLEGVIPPLTTPFEDGKVSPEKLRENIARYEERGVGGYLLLGSSGEAALLDEEEKALVLRTARTVIPDHRPMLAGVGMESTAATIRLAKVAADSGADLLLVLTPHYYGDQMGDDALEAHYRAVANASPVPILLYNVPKFTHVQISLDAAACLSAHENIVGLKESSGNLDRIVELLPRVPREFEVVCGHAGIFDAALAKGARAAILAAADVFPEAFVGIWRLTREGKQAEAAKLQDAISAASRLVVSTHGIPGIKAAMDMRGLYGGPPRPPLLPAHEEARREIRREIGKLVEDAVLSSVG